MKNKLKDFKIQSIISFYCLLMIRYKRTTTKKLKETKKLFNKEQFKNNKKNAIL